MNVSRALGFWSSSSCGTLPSFWATSTARRAIPSGTRVDSSSRSSRLARLAEDQLPKIRLHDLRHTRATLLLADGVPVTVVSERLGHADATITLTVYRHMHPGMSREAAERFAALLDG
jgi:integrase